MRSKAHICKTILLTVLFLISFGNKTVAQDSLYIDSLLNITESRMHDTIKCEVFQELATSFRKKRPQESIKYYHRAKEIIEKHLEKDRTPLSYYSEHYPIVLSGFGSLYRKLEDYGQALVYYTNAYIAYVNLEDSTGIGDALADMGKAYRYKKDYDSSIYYYQQSLDIWAAVYDSSEMLNCYSSIGLMYRKKEDYKSATSSYMSALKFAEQLRDTSELIDAYFHLGVVYSKNNYQKSENNLSNALRLAIEHGSETTVAKIRYNLAGVYLNTDRPEKAIEFCKMALAIYEQEKSLNKLKNLHLRLSTAYKIIGNNAKALEHLFEHMSYSDMLDNEEDTKEVVRMEMNLILEKERIADSIAFAKQKEISDLEIKEKNAKLEKYTAQKIALFGGLFLFLIMAVVAYRSYRRKKQDNALLTQEKERSERLLLNILPHETAEELKEYGSAKARSYDLVSVLFTDFKGFTNISEELSSEELVAEIDHCYKEFDRIIERCNIEKIKTIGDAYMCAGGLPGKNATHPFDAVKAALEIRDFMEQYKSERDAEGKPRFEIRIGIHTGPVVAGIVGIRKFAYDIWGDTVNIASRMESSGEVGMVNISNSTYELVNDKFDCTYRGKIAAKNKGDIDMYFVSGPKS